MSLFTLLTATGKRYQKPLAVLVVLCLILTGITYTTDPSNLTRLSTVLRDRPTLQSPQSSSTSSNTDPAHHGPRSRHPILILQHDCKCRLLFHKSDEHAASLSELSERQHRQYAEAHGYVYRLSTGQYVPRQGWGGSNYMNKVFLTLQVMLEELEREDRVEWIM